MWLYVCGSLSGWVVDSVVGLVCLAGGVLANRRFSVPSVSEVGGAIAHHKSVKSPRAFGHTQDARRKTRRNLYSV